MKQYPTTFLILTVLSFLALSLRAIPAAASDENGQWAVSAGAFNIDDSEITRAEAGVEYRLKAYKIPGGAAVPAIGVSGSDDGNFWLYGTFRYDWYVSDSWRIVPQVGVSFYEEGDGKDLGGSVQFRSGLEIAYLFESGMRVGVLFYHLSNSGLEDRNPGSNSLVLTWGF